MNILRGLNLAGKRILQPDASVDGFTVKYNHTLGQFEYQDLRVSALFKYSATNYNDLLTKTGMVVNDVALVLNSQGVLWINYKGSGFYIYDGTNWVSDKGAITNELSNILTSVSALEKQDNIVNVTTSSYAVLPQDYIINISADSTITLPLISSMYIGKTYKIFTDNSKLSILPSPSDTIDGNPSFELEGYSCITLRALSINKWRIGD